jgi:uridine kinase
MIDIKHFITNIFSFLLFAYLANNFFKIYQFLNSKFIISIAGDSGSGKDYLVKLISHFFLHDELALVNGDNYHNWDRRSLKWSRISHLDPSANNLNQLYKDIKKLQDNQIIVQKTYEHIDGTFRYGHKILPKKIIIINSLFSFYTDDLDKISNIKIFLEPDLNIKRKWKYERDIKYRGKNLNDINATEIIRQRDYKKYISRQISKCDLFIKIHESRKVKRKNLINLQIRSKLLSINDISIRYLISLCGLNVISTEIDGINIFEIQGILNDKYLKLSFEKLELEISQFLKPNYNFSNGIDGLIEYFVLIIFNEKL